MSPDIRGTEYDGTPCDECGVVHGPTTEQIGGYVVRHGERDTCTACLCGVSYYLYCWDYIEGTDTIAGRLVRSPP